MKKFNKVLLLALALVLAALAAGCASKPAAAPEVNVPVQDIADDLLAMEEQFGAMTQFDPETLTEMTGLDFSLLSEYSLNDAMMNVKSHILYVAKLNDAKDMDAVKAAFQKRLELMQETFATYLPDQYEIAMDGKIVDNGKYVLLVVSEDSQKVVDRFNELLKAE
jgi:hypothetical protein